MSIFDKEKKKQNTQDIAEADEDTEPEEETADRDESGCKEEEQA